MIPTQTLRKAVGAAADVARLWFEDRTAVNSRADFDTRGGLKDSGEGAVYAYFDDHAALYVGLTKRRVKARLHDQTHPHKQKPWWPRWTTMRFVQLPDDMDRQILEFLLILAYGPLFNAKPKAKVLDDLLPA